MECAAEQQHAAAQLAAEAREQLLLLGLQVRRLQVREHHHAEGRDLGQLLGEAVQELARALDVLAEHRVRRGARQPGHAHVGVAAQRAADELEVPGERALHEEHAELLLASDPHRRLGGARDRHERRRRGRPELDAVLVQPLGVLRDVEALAPEARGRDPPARASSARAVRRAAAPARTRAARPRPSPGAARRRGRTAAAAPAAGASRRASDRVGAPTSAPKPTPTKGTRDSTSACSPAAFAPRAVGGAVAERDHRERGGLAARHRLLDGAAEVGRGPLRRRARRRQRRRHRRGVEEDHVRREAARPQRGQETRARERRAPARSAACPPRAGTCCGCGRPARRPSSAARDPRAARPPAARAATPPAGTRRRAAPRAPPCARAAGPRAAGGAPTRRGAPRPAARPRPGPGEGRSGATSSGGLLLGQPLEVPLDALAIGGGQARRRPRGAAAGRPRRRGARPSARRGSARSRPSACGCARRRSACRRRAPRPSRSAGPRCASPGRTCARARRAARRALPRAACGPRPRRRRPGAA